MRNVQQLIGVCLTAYPGIFERLDRIITPVRAFALFKTIADTYAPTLTVRYTRAPVIEQILTQASQEGVCGDGITFYRNFQTSGNVALTLGREQRKPIWSMAHLDIISFLTGTYTDGRYRLTPYCEARQTPGTRPALALNYSLATGAMEQVAEGWLHSEAQGHFFETPVADLPPATRVVYSSVAEWDQSSGMVYGTVDDAFGAAALVLSTLVLSHYPVDALVLLTDEEEGVVAPGPQAFARASTRLLNRMPPDLLPDLITISDLHEEVSDLQQKRLNASRFGQGALFAAFASGARGGVTPPHLLAFERELAAYLAQRNVRLHENMGYVSRSDCVSAMLATPNVALIGFPAAYSHFIETPRAHIDDLVALAKSLAVFTLIAQDASWREQFLFR